MDILITILVLCGCLVLGYLLGSISNGIIIGKIRTNKDIRDYGSHNAGGTNAGRVMGAKWGIIVILLDMLKTITAVLTSYFVCKYSGVAKFTVFADDVTEFSELAYILASVGAIIGHSFPIFFKFKGGKCVATFAGIVVASSWVSLILGFIVFMLVLIIWKHVSLASMIGSLSCALVSIVYVLLPFEINSLFMNLAPASWYYVALMFGATIYLWYRHKANIGRLLRHEESVIDITKKFKRNKANTNVNTND